MLLHAYVYARVAIGDVRASMHRRLVDMAGDERGATAAEYALLVSLIAIAIILGATHLGGSINTKLDGTATKIGAVPIP
jgi:pilus assembly protein Flp/PilA